MVLMNLNDVSLAKIMKCLYNNKKDRITLRHFCRCSYGINEIAVKNGLSKIPEATLAFNGVESLIRKSVECAFEPYCPSVMRLDGEKLSASYLDVPLHIPHTPSQAVHWILKSIPNYVKKVKGLSMKELTLDANLLKVFTTNKDFIRSTSHLNISGVQLEWSANELLEFLKLFDNLEKFNIEGNCLENIITNEHLSLVNSIRIWDSTSEKPFFSGITADICDVWMKNRVEYVCFPRISSEIVFSSVHKVINHLLEKHGHEQSSRLNSLIGNFGQLKYSEDCFREIALAQRQRYKNWEINQKNKYLTNYMITRENSKQFICFTIASPLDASFFGRFLATFKKRRTMVESIEEDEDFEESVDQLQIETKINLTQYYKIIRMKPPTTNREQLERNEDEQIEPRARSLKKLDFVQKKIEDITKEITKTKE